LNSKSVWNTVAIALQEQEKTPVEFENEFTKLTVLANLDANVFYPSGKLMATSQPLIFENSLLAPYINPLPLNAFNKATELLFRLNKLVICNSMLRILSFTHQILVIKQEYWLFHFFNLPPHWNKCRLRFWQTSSLFFALIFIALIAISFLVTKWLTAPLRIITKTMGRVSLTGSNKPLQWQSDDEIGLMAREYNHMLVKLNDSKLELERNSKGACLARDCQQVAHEIKNPLTPMKLTFNSWNAPC